MRIVGAISLLVGLVFAPSMSAAESALPSRKPGLWQVKTIIDHRDAQARTVEQCIDGATDEMLQSNAGPIAASACLRRNVTRAENSMSIDSTCTLGGKPATAHAVISGSLDSAYTMQVTSESGDLPGGKMVMMMEAKWLGPCAADQKPGDVIMGNGVKVNIPEMQKQK
jgi:Protein of unknown function (DUF3617)